MKDIIAFFIVLLGLVYLSWELVLWASNGTLT